MTPPDNKHLTLAPERRGRSPWRRVHLYVRVFLVMCVLTAPAIIARVDDIRWQRLTRNGVRSADGAPPSSPAALGENALLTLYLAGRSPNLDTFLPAGAGGTVFVPTLPNVRGLAFSRSSSIIVSLEDGSGPTLNAIEIHERAHLAHAQLSEEVNALLRTLASPEEGSYAATNSREHFAEMASEAWQLLQPPGHISGTFTATERLQRMESAVPGTSGFVTYFLRHPTFATHPGADTLRASAALLMTPAREQWDRLFAALDARRQNDGTLTAWPVPTIREWVDLHRAEQRAEGTVVGYVHALAFWPSAMLLRLMGA